MLTDADVERMKRYGRDLRLDGYDSPSYAEEAARPGAYIVLLADEVRRLRPAWIEGPPTTAGHFWVRTRQGSIWLADAMWSRVEVDRDGSTRTFGPMVVVTAPYGGISPEEITHHMPIARPAPPAQVFSSTSTLNDPAAASMTPLSEGITE